MITPAIVKPTKYLCREKDKKRQREKERGGGREGRRGRVEGRDGRKCEHRLILIIIQVCLPIASNFVHTTFTTQKHQIMYSWSTTKA